MRHVYQDQTIGGADILNSLADVNIGNPEDGQMLVYDASTQRWRNVTQKSLNDLAEVTDLTNVIATGSTNATGSTIPKGLYFYLNDELCQAKADIASGATFTLNTNYEVVTAGGLNSLNSALGNKLSYINWANSDSLSGAINHVFTKDSYFECLTVTNTASQTWSLDGNVISVGDSSGGSYVIYASGFAKAGQRLQGAGIVKYFELL